MSLFVISPFKTFSKGIKQNGNFSNSFIRFTAAWVGGEPNILMLCDQSQDASSLTVSFPPIPRSDPSLMWSRTEAWTDVLDYIAWAIIATYLIISESIQRIGHQFAELRHSLTKLCLEKYKHILSISFLKTAEGENFPSFLSL